MDKNFLMRVNNALKRVKTTILLNDEVRKLLWYSGEPTAIPTVEQVADHVFLQPVIDVETTEPFNKKNYITLTIPEGTKASNKVEYTLRVIVMSDKSDWNINGDIRPLLIAQHIINDLEGVKFDFSNPLYFDSIVETVTSKDVCGYSILFNVVDGVSDTHEK